MCWQFEEACKKKKKPWTLTSTKSMSVKCNLKQNPASDVENEHYRGELSYCENHHNRICVELWLNKYRMAHVQGLCI